MDAVGSVADQGQAPAEDAVEDFWRTYYAPTFNPARLRPQAMRAEMPKRYWKNLPEARLIASLAASAGRRTQAMLATHPEQPAQAVRAIAGGQSTGRHENRNPLKINTRSGEG